MKNAIKINLFIILLILLVSSCRVTQPYKQPQLLTAGLYRDVDTNDTTTIADLSWKTIFADTLLQQLIDTALANNIDLKIAYSRINEAEAYWQQSKLAFFPAVTADANVTVAGSSNQAAIGKPVTPRQYQAQVTASWEADIWGKLKSSRKASLADLLQSADNSRAIKSSLVANVALYYYQLLALDEQLSVSEQTAKNWQSTVDVMTELKKADVVTSAAIVQSEASKYATLASIPDIRQSIRETENQLNYLMGHSPGAIKRSSLADQHPVSALQTGVPVQLLANRPDVRAAEDNLRYYFELTNVARTYFYPSFTLSASGGYLSNDLLFSPLSVVSNLVAGVTQPIFSQGMNRTRLKVAKAQQQQAALNFESVLLSSGQEVSNALYSYSTAMEKMTIRETQLINLKKSVDYTQELVRYGFANYTEVLTAQQNLLTGQLSRINDKQQQLQSIVKLYNALGGGWK